MPRVRWDRYVPGEFHLSIYGWLDRPDDHADFVLIDVYPATRDQPRLQVYFTTSSADEAFGREAAEAIGVPFDSHTDCVRVEHSLPDVTNAIKLGA